MIRKYIFQNLKKNLEEKFDLESFDIIHAHYWLSGLIAKQISEELNIPYIFTSHSLGVFLEGYNKERVDCEKLVMKSSSFITASSQYENNLISENYDIDKKKIKLNIRGNIISEFIKYCSEEIGIKPPSV